MGTLGYLAWDPVALDVGEALSRRAAEIEGHLTRFSEKSEIMKLSASWREISADSRAVLEAAGALTAETDGFFNPLLGAQMRLWEDLAIGGLGVLPSPQRATGRIELAGDRARLVDAEEGSVDLGGIAKGYAADQLRDDALSMGALNVLVSLGGSSIAVAGEPAVIGLASPWQGLESFGTIRLESGSLSVSADPGTIIGPDVQRSHILNPQRGLPAATDPCQVVVCGPDGMVCEALSSAYMAMGLDAALVLDQSRSDLQTIFMTVDGRVLASPDLEVTAQSGAQDWLKQQRRMS